MAYKGQKTKITRLGKDVLKEPYRSDNARKVNAKKNNDGYLYILKIENTNHYKIGVSGSPKRRIRDIRSASPYNIDVIYLYKYLDTYKLEEIIHNNLKGKEMRHEWFDLDDNEITDVIYVLNQIKIENLAKNK